MAKLEFDARAYQVQPVPIDIQVVRDRAAEIEIEAGRFALQPLLTREECDIATNAVLAAGGSWAPWLDWVADGDMPSGGPPNACRSAQAEAAGLASVASSLASLPSHLTVAEAMAMAEMYLAAAVRMQRKAGRMARGDQQRADAAVWWRPWQERYRQLRAAGMNVAEARRAVAAEMVDAGVTLPARRVSGRSYAAKVAELRRRDGLLEGEEGELAD